MRSTHLSDNQEEVLKAVRALREENSGPVRTSQVRERTGKGSSHTSDLLGDLVDNGELVKLKRGVYDIPEFTDDNQPEETSPQDSQESHVSEWPISHGGGGSGPADSSDVLRVDDRLIRSYVGYIPDQDEAFFFRIKGDSMQPWLSEGDFVFALHAEEVTAPSRYVIKWGEHESQICVHLSPLQEDIGGGENSEKIEGEGIQLTEYGPRRTKSLRHISGDLYETRDGDQVRMQIHGRVVWPSSDPQNMIETITDQIGKVVGKANYP